MHREVNLTKRVQTTKGPRYCKAVLSNNGRVKPDVVLVDEREERHPEGAITSNGAMRESAFAYRSARMRLMPAPCVCGKRQS